MVRKHRGALHFTPCIQAFRFNFHVFLQEQSLEEDQLDHLLPKADLIPLKKTKTNLQSYPSKTSVLVRAAISVLEIHKRSI